jgi:hypothetical protein
VLSHSGREFTPPGAITIASGAEITVATERPSVSLGLQEMNQGSWVMFELPGFTTANSGTPQDSLDALRKANATSYYRGDDALWVKLVVANTGGGGARGGGGPGGGTSIEVSR